MTAQIKKGFTLIELLIVIAVLGVLAAVVLVALNPVQQLARGRDSSRLQSIGQIGRSMEAYGTTHNSAYVTESATWLTDLVASGEMQQTPAAPAFSAANAGFGAVLCLDRTNCGTGAVSSTGPWCYDSTGTAFAIYTRAESSSANSKCTASGLPCAYFAYLSSQGRAGTVCTGTAAAPSAATTSFVD